MSASVVPPRRVQLFATCLIEAFRPEAGMSVVKVLERSGLEVEFPAGQTCCGQPAFNAGFWKEARAMARHTLQALARRPDPVVVPSGSCADMIVHRYPELLGGDRVYGPLAREVAARTFEFSQFLVDVMRVTCTDARTSRRVVYHPSCHLSRGLGVVEQPRRLLGGLAPAALCELSGETECCGFGGLFAVRMSDISGAMLARKLDAIQASGAELVVGCDVSCLLNIEGGLRRRGSSIRTRHLAELLAAGGEA